MKEKEKRKISVLTIFLWIALVITMSVVVISGINKSNALEENSETSMKTITVKIDFTRLLENENYDEENKKNIIGNMTDVVKIVDEKENINVEQGIEYESTFIGIDDGIGTYELNITNGEAKYILFENNNEAWNEYTILENNSRLENFTKNSIKYLVKGLENGKNVYEFKVEKNVLKTITIKVDHSMWIKIAKEQYKDNPNNLNGWIQYYLRMFSIYLCDNEGNNIGDKSRYINMENNIAIYEVDILNGLSYESINVNFSSDYPGANNNERYYLIENNNPLQIINVPYRNSVISIFREKINEEQNVYEFEFNKTKPVTIKVDCSNMEEEDKRKFLQTDIDIIAKENSGDNRRVDYDKNFIVKIIEKNDNYAIYEAYLLPIEYYSIKLATFSRKYDIYNDDKVLPKTWNSGWYSYQNINPINAQNEITFVFKECEPKITSDIKWEDNNKVKLQYNIQGGKEFFDENGTDMPEYRIFKEKLDKDFSISDEYENDSKWLIVNEEEIMNEKINFKSDTDSQYYEEFILNIGNNENIPEYVFATFFKYYKKMEHEIYYINGIYPTNDKTYIYIKDKNILYFLNEYSNIIESINLKYIKNDDISNKKFEFNTDVVSLYRYWHGSGYYDELQYMNIPINKKEIEYKEKERTEIVVNKLVKEEKGNNIYHIGLFESEEDEVTDKIYKLETED